MTERRAQLVSAFVELLARESLESVTLDDVATAAGMKRSALNHFVGSRDDLIVAAVDVVADRFIIAFREVAATEPTIEQFLAVVFSSAWVRGFGVEVTAFGALLSEAMRNTRTRARMKSAVDELIDQIEAALRRSHPNAPSAAVQETGYAIACLIDSSTTLRQLGYPHARVRGVIRAALALAAMLGRQDSG